MRTPRVPPSGKVFSGFEDFSDADIAALGEGRYVVRDGVLGRQVAREARRGARRVAMRGGLRQAAVGRGGGRVVCPDVRGDEIAWLTAADAPSELLPVFQLFRKVQDALNRGAYLGLVRHEVQLARYPGNGTHYDRHVDTFAGTARRSATALYYLNPHWRPEHGGILRLHLPGGPVDIEPVSDRLLVFLSDQVEHEVRPTFAPRLSLTAWYYRSPL